MLQSPDTYGTTLLVWAMEVFGTECLYDKDDPDRGPWHPATFRAGLEGRFGVTLPDENLDKLMAAVAILTNDRFFHETKAFIDLCNILSGDDFDPEVFDPADSMECAWGLIEATFIRPPDDDDNDDTWLSADIRRYIGFVCEVEGLLKPPHVLAVAMAQDRTDRVTGLDPELAEAVRSGQKGREDEINAVVADQVKELIEQVKALPLREGKAEELVERFGQFWKDESSRLRELKAREGHRRTK